MGKAVAGGKGTTSGIVQLLQKNLNSHSTSVL